MYSNRLRRMMILDRALGTSPASVARYAAPTPVVHPAAPEPKDCAECQDRTNPVSHKGSRVCRCGSIASGGTTAHCTCDACF